jgi:nucleoside-diphosphate-sugar epimerase
MTSKLSTKVAILGVTGYIGRGLLHEYMKEEAALVTGYSLDVESAKKILAGYGVPFGDIKGYDQFLDNKYDVIINATGIGSPRKLSEDPSAVFAVTEEMDQVIFRYLDQYPNARVFSLSSGAVYGLAGTEAVSNETVARFAVNTLDKKDAYALAKLSSEAKHRARPDRFIIDLRIFSFISRYMDPSEPFFLSEIARSLLDSATFKTDRIDIVRDYTSAMDIVAIVKFLAVRPAANDVFDIKTVAPISKQVLLNELKTAFGLDFIYEDIGAKISPTGQKNAYHSTSTKLEDMGFVPPHSSLDNIKRELAALLSK